MFSNLNNKSEFLSYFFKNEPEPMIKKIKEVIKDDEIIPTDENQTTFELILGLDIYLRPCDFSQPDFRGFIINYLKEYYENHALYIFFLEKIYYEEIKTRELPLFRKQGEFYYTRFPIKCLIHVFSPGMIVEMSLNYNITNNDIIEIYGENKYLSCKLTHDRYMILKYGEKVVVLKNISTNEKIKIGQKILVKLETFHNNKTNIGFNKKINCSGKLTS